MEISGILKEKNSAWFPYCILTAKSIIGTNETEKLLWFGSYRR